MRVVLCLIVTIMTSVFCYGNEEQTKVLKVGFSNVDSFPYEYQIDGQVHGLHIEMIRRVAQDFGYEVEAYSLPWKRILSMVAQGQLDAVSYMGGYRNSHKMTWFYGGNAMTLNGFYLMNLKSNKELTYHGDISVLEGKTVGVLRGYHFIEYQDETLGVDNLTIVEVSAPEQLLDMLERGRIDAAIVMRSTLAQYRRGELPGFKVHTRPISTIYVYVGFSKAVFEQAFVEEFGDAMKAFQDTGEFLKLQSYYDGLAAKKQ